MSLRLGVLLLAAVGVYANTQSGNSQGAVDLDPTSPGLTAPAELVPVSAENRRFSRLLKDSANVLQFSSISNDAPPIWGISRDGKKDGKEPKGTKVGKKSSLAAPGSNFGRRALDYDEQIQAFEEPTSESKIIANPYPGNEYVFIRAGKLQQHVEAPADSEVAASVTSINNKPPRVPLALLRQKKGKRVNISPLFTEVPQIHQDSVDAAAKEFVWVDQPVEHHHHRFISVNRQGRKHADNDDATTNPAFQDEDLIEATTLADETPFETTTPKENKSKLIVNIVTSAPRVSVESSVSEKKKPSRRAKSTTTSTTTGVSTTSEVTTEASTTTTTFATSTTPQVQATVAPIVLSSSTPKAIPADDKENLVADAFHRSGTSFHGFEDSQTRLQTAESSQPARVNVRPAQNGKEYEYEYIYYYYDDDDENSEKHGAKHGEPQVKAVEQTKDVKSAAAPRTSSTSSAASSDAPSSTTVTISSSSTTSTTTLAPDLTSDADFEYEDDAALEEEEIQAHSPAPELQKSVPAAPRIEEPIHKAVSSAEKLSNSNPINQLDRSRSPKILPGKFDESVADYKLETEASQEEEVVQPQTQALSKGQPPRQLPASSEEDEQTIDPELEQDEEELPHESPVPAVPVTREPSTTHSVPASQSTSSGFDTEHMSTLAKTHKDSVNSPIVIKQSSLLKAVPVSQLQSHQTHLPEERPSTAPFTTPTTTTTTVEAASEVIPSVRPSPPRLRGQHRLRGSVTPRPSTSSTTAEAVVEQPAEEKPVQQANRRPNFRDSSRRIPSRRPVQEASQNAQDQQPDALPIIDAPARPLPIRPRFPPRSGGRATTTAAAPSEAPVSETPVAAVTVSAVELNSLDDKKAKDAHVRSKAANDLFAFARLQQAISSRAPSRVQPKLVAGFVNSAEVTTDAITSSEVTTVSSFGGQSGETLGAVSAEPTSTTTTTTTTTTEAVQLDKFGRQRGGAGAPRFGGRTRKPVGGAVAPGGGASLTTTEAPPTTRGRFTGRRRTSTTENPEGSSQQTSAAVTNSEAPKASIPSRNRFASRNRVSTTEATPAVDQQKAAEGSAPSTPRRRPGTYPGRRRANQVQTDAPSTPEETASTSADSTVTTGATSTAAPSTPGRNRFNFAAAGGRQRPAAAAAHAPANNAIRIRGGGRLRGPTTTTTTEAAPVESGEEIEQAPPADAEQSQSIQNENLEKPIQSAPVPESVVPQRGGGVLGRLKSRPKLVVTTTPPSEISSDRKPSRLNGILNRRKNIGQLPGGVHVKEEVRETTSEVAEEANNHAQEQDDDHKGVVVQISSSVTESEEVNEGHDEVVEPPSTTPGSILNRLKTHRKPGSLFRKKPDPHGE